MSITKKLAIFLIIISIITGAGIYYSSKFVIEERFSNLEQNAIKQSVTQVFNAINGELNSLEVLTNDYASWNDTYDFIEDNNEKYINSNLVDETFANANVDFLMLLNNDQKIVFSKYFDTESKVDLNNKSEIINKFTDHTELTKHTSSESNIKGTILTRNGLLLFSSQPILTSQNSGPVRGTLVMGRLLGNSEINELRTITNLTVDFFRIDELPWDLMQIMREDLSVSSISGRLRDNNYAFGYGVYKDSFGKPALFVRVTLARDIFQVGQNTINYILSGFLFFAILIIFSVFAFLHILFIKPIKKLITSLKSIRSLEGQTGRVPEFTKDEVGDLGRELNKMFCEIEKSEQSVRLANEDLKKEKTSVEEQVSEQTKRLRDEQARLKAAINSVPDGFIILDQQKSVILTNNALSSLLHSEIQIWTFEKLCAYFKNFFDFNAEYKLCFESKKVVEKKELEINDSYIDFYFAPVFTDEENDSIHGVIVLLHDITHRKKLDQAKDDFLSIASHELRTPLTAIRGNTELLRSYFRNRIQDSDFAEIVEDIHLSSKRLIEIVTTFLQTSRLEQGKIQFSIEKIVVLQMLDSIIKRLKPLAEQKHIYLTCAGVTEELVVLADRIRFDEVLTNLVSNAIQMTDSGIITISAGRLGEKIKISVSDTGRGIPQEMQNLLFKKFQQINDNPYARDSMHTPYSRDTTQGTGLGLYISRLLVEAMGGSIYLENSELGKGSTFTFTLPAFVQN